MKKILIAVVIVLISGITAVSLANKTEAKPSVDTKTEKAHFAGKGAATTFDVATAD